MNRAVLLAAVIFSSSVATSVRVSAETPAAHWKFLQHANGMTVYLGPAEKDIGRQDVLLVCDAPQPLPEAVSEGRSFRSTVLELSIACTYPPLGGPGVIDLMEYFFASTKPARYSARRPCRDGRDWATRGPGTATSSS
jgi:hypothetical protein